MNKAAEGAELTFAGMPETPPAHLNRALKPRHLNMIAIGGSIGTGLFVASGARSPPPARAARSSPTGSSARWCSS